MSFEDNKTNKKNISSQEDYKDDLLEKLSVDFMGLVEDCSVDELTEIESMYRRLPLSLQDKWERQWVHNNDTPKTILSDLEKVTEHRRKMYEEDQSEQKELTSEDEDENNILEKFPIDLRDLLEDCSVDELTEIESMYRRLPLELKETWEKRWCDQNTEPKTILSDLEKVTEHRRKMYEEDELS
jgi:hypothetical protein